MRELDFDIEASLERWTEWYLFESDGDSDSCCKTYELDDPILMKAIKDGYVDIDLTLPLSDYSWFSGRTDMSPLPDIYHHGQDAPEGI